MSTSAPQPIKTTGDKPVFVDHTPAGVVVVTVGRSMPIRYEPDDAARFADALKEQAQNAIHASRLTRRTA
jgi:hypothetical protein